MFVIQTQFITSWLKAFLLASSSRSSWLGCLGHSAKEAKPNVYLQGQVATFPPHAGPRQQLEPTVQVDAMAEAMGAPGPRQQEQGLRGRRAWASLSCAFSIVRFRLQGSEGKEEPEFTLQPPPPLLFFHRVYKST